MTSNPTPDPARVIRAPWTPDQVDALNAFQRRGGMHPFTCGGEHTPASPALVAYTDGWRCPQPYGESCDYRQDWAHAFMAEQPAAPPSVSAVDQTTRDRIAEAVRRQAETGNVRYEAIADAVLAVLPPPADRAAVLREEAALIRAHCPDHLDSNSAEGSWINCHCDVADDMERRADEAQQPAVEARQPDTETPREWCKCPSCWGWFVEDHPGEDLDELGKDLGWWSGLPVHRDAPAAASAVPGRSAATSTDEEQPS